MSARARSLVAFFRGALVVTVSLVVAMAAQDPSQAGLRAALTVATMVSVTGAYLALALLRRRSGHRGSALQACALMIYCLTLVLCAGELRFTTLDRSHSVNFTLAGKLWLARHYRYNSYHHRGPEPDPRLLESKRRIVVVGDSFAAGHGVEESERFSDLLTRRVPDDHLVVNNAVSGDNSRQLYRGLESFPWPPHVLVLSYFGNDIQDAAEEAGQRPPAIVPYGDLPTPARLVVERSYFLDYLYWSWPHDYLAGWWEFFAKAWKDPAVRALHERELEGFVEFSRSRGIPMVVVVFPFLHDPETSKLYVPHVKQFFEGRGVKVIDVEVLIEDLTIEERVATVSDMHPSPVVHARVADALAEALPALIAAERR